MSGWWDAAALASIATNAIKTAQKKIDKVLDIKEGEGLHASQAASTSSQHEERPQENDNDDIAAERNEHPVNSEPQTVQPFPPRSTKVGVLPAVKISTETTESLRIAVEEDIQTLHEDSSSLMSPFTDNNPVPVALAQSSPSSPELRVKPSSELSTNSESWKGMVSSSEDTLVSDSVNNGEDSINETSDNCQDNDRKPSPVGSHTPVSTRSIESPSFSEANSSCMGSELVRVEVAPSTSSDIEIVSTPSSCCVENYIPVQQPGDSRHFRPLVPAGLLVEQSVANNQKREQSTSTNTGFNNSGNSAPDATAAALMKQLTEITRSVEKKDARILELSEENTLLHTQLMEIRRQMDSAAAADAAFGADTVRLLKNEIKDRDQTINELREEGDKLSRQQAQGSALIKKLRAKEKELDGQLADAQRKNEDLQAKISQLERTLTLRLEGEKQSAETLQQMTAAVKRMEREVAEKQQQLSDTKEELGQLEKRVSSVGDTSKEREIKLLERIEQLGEVVRELEEKALTSERQRKIEIAELEAKLEVAASYTEQLREGATSAARPVVKQLETLQQSYAMASKNWNETERTMSLKIAQLEQSLQQAEARARESEANAASNEKKQRDNERHLEQCRFELTKVQAVLVQLEADRDIWKRRVSNLESMCEQERARAAGFERRAADSESRLSMSSSSSQRRYNEMEASLQKMERDHSELSVRYEKLLEMYGEKAEEAEELRADVAELRAVFREHFSNFGNNNSNNQPGQQDQSPNSTALTELSPGGDAR